MTFTMKMSIAIVVFFVVLLRIGPYLYLHASGRDMPPGTVVDGPSGTYSVR